MLYKVVLVFSSVTFNSKVAVNFKVSVAIHVKATEQYFPMVLFIMLYKVVLTFESGWNPKVGPFKWRLLSSTFLWYFYYAVQGGSNFWV